MSISNATFIYFIIKYQFEEFIQTLEKDFSKNYLDKQHNFIINSLNPETVAYLTLVSSFESKYGNRLETIAKQITKLSYGNNNVPEFINPHNLLFTIPNNHKGQSIVSELNMADKKVVGKIANFRTENERKGSGKNQISCKLNHRKSKQLLKIYNFSNVVDGNIHLKPVDLAFYDNQSTLNIIELKAGGNLDSSNGPKNIEKLLTIYTGVKDIDAKIYFATLYNKDGEGNRWKGNASKYLKYPEMFLIGKDFWNKILPSDVSFDYFLMIYNYVLQELKIDKVMSDLIKDKGKE